MEEKSAKAASGRRGKVRFTIRLRREKDAEAVDLMESLTAKGEMTDYLVSLIAADMRANGLCGDGAGL